MQNEKPRVGVVVIVHHNGKVLLGKRKNSLESGMWSIPGGHLEFGETPEHCAKRELMEETGLKALSLRPRSWTNNMIEGRHYVMLFMIVDSFSGEPELKEPDKCEGWGWFDPKQLPQPLFSPIVSFLKNHSLIDS